MHTVLVILGGFVLLGLCLLIGKFNGSPQGGVAQSALLFLPMWLLGAGINLWFGTRAGYTVREELPIFLLIFAIPTFVALGIWRLTKTS